MQTTIRAGILLITFNLFIFKPTDVLTFSVGMDKGYAKGKIAYGTEKKVSPRRLSRFRQHPTDGWRINNIEKDHINKRLCVVAQPFQRSHGEIGRRLGLKHIYETIYVSAETHIECTGSNPVATTN